MKRISFITCSIMIVLCVYGQTKDGYLSFGSTGEELSYDLYFKYGLINSKAGVSSLKISEEKYRDVDALRMTMTAHSTGIISKVFDLSDTLSCYITKDLRPLLYIKKAHEGSEHTEEQITYNYTDKEINIRNKRIRNGILRFDENMKSETVIYDMMSIVYYVRTLDYNLLEKNKVLTVNFLSGKDIVKMDICYNGKETVRANDGKKYNCIKLNMVIYDNAFTDKKKAMQVYISNDDNRRPVRIDSKLKIGSTKIILKKVKMNR